MQGCKKYQIGRCQIPEGVPIFLGEIKWGCQISWGAKYPVTPDYAKTTFQRLNHGLQPEILAVKGFGFQKKIIIIIITHCLLAISNIEL